MKLTAFATLALIVASSLQAAHAVPAEARFTGTVTSSSAPALGAVGSTFSGSFTFDLDPLRPPMYSCPDGTCSLYEYSAPNGFSVALGDAVWTSQAGIGISVNNNSTISNPSKPPQDGFDMSGRSGPYDFRLLQTGPTSSFSNTVLPSLQTLNSFADARLFVITQNRFDVVLRGEITSFSVSAIPEPATVALFGVGLAAVFIRHRKAASNLRA